MPVSIIILVNILSQECGHYYFKKLNVHMLNGRVQWDFHKNVGLKETEGNHQVHFPGLGKDQVYTEHF